MNTHSYELKERYYHTLIWELQDFLIALNNLGLGPQVNYFDDTGAAALIERLIVDKKI